jgi:hypothetical protein
MNTAFKHLDAKLRIAELTIRQWVGMCAGVMIALFYADLVHPFGTMVTMITAVYIAGIPIAAAFVGGLSEFDIWLVLRCALRWRTTDGRYLSGPGVPTDGYRVHSPVEDLFYPDQEELSELDLAGLWGER